METNRKPWARPELLWIQHLILGATTLNVLGFHPNAGSCLHAMLGRA